MSITVQEKWRSPELGEGENAYIDSAWRVRGTDDAWAAKTALRNGTPVILDGLVRESYTVSRMGRVTWNGNVRYGRYKKKEAGDSTYSFDTRATTQHVTQSLETIGNYAPAGQVAPNYHGAVGVTLDSVEGVDIPWRNYAFTETHYFAKSYVTQAYKLLLYGLTTTVNGAVFRGFARGECLFDGAAGSLRGDDEEALWEITFHFRCLPSAVNLAIGSGIVIPAKEGWHFVWAAYKKVVDGNPKRLIARPASAHVERMLDYGNFAGLGIGG